MGTERTDQIMNSVYNNIALQAANNGVLNIKVLNLLLHHFVKSESYNTVLLFLTICIFLV